MSWGQPPYVSGIYREKGGLFYYISHRILPTRRPRLQRLAGSTSNTRTTLRTGSLPQLGSYLPPPPFPLGDRCTSSLHPVCRPSHQLV